MAKLSTGALGADASHKANSRRERHCPAGALDHPIDHAAGDARRGLICHGLARGGGLRFEIRHGSRADLGGGGNALVP